MDYRISNLIARKKNYALTIIMTIYMLVAISISLVGSASMFQYESSKRNYTENMFAKTIAVTSYSEKANGVRSLGDKDVENIIQLLDSFAINKYQIIKEQQINFGIQTDIEEIVFVKSFSGELPIEDAVMNDRDLAVRNKNFSERVKLYIPIIDSKEDGFTSSKTQEMEYRVQVIDDKSAFQNWFKDDEVIVSEKAFREIIGVMFGRPTEVEASRIYVALDKINDIRPTANALSSSGYNVHHAFEYYEDLDGDIFKSAKLSVMVLTLILIFSVAIIVGIFELTLRNSSGDIAVLVHLGYSAKRICKIYIIPFFKRLLIAMLVALAGNLAMYYCGIISDMNNVLVSFSLSIAFLSLIVIYMYIRVYKYSVIGVVKLLKKYKAEE